MEQTYTKRAYNKQIFRVKALEAQLQLLQDHLREVHACGYGARREDG